MVLNRLESRQYSPPSCYMQHTRLSLAYDAVEDDDRPKGKKKKELLNDEMPRTVHRNLLLYVCVIWEGFLVNFSPIFPEKFTSAFFFFLS